MTAHYDLPPLEYLTKFMSWIFHVDGDTVFRIKFLPTETFGTIDNIVNCYHRLNNLMKMQSFSFFVSFQSVNIKYELDGITNSINLPIQCLDIMEINTKNTITIKPIIENVTIEKFGKNKICIINVNMTSFLSQLENLDNIKISTMPSTSFVY